MGEWGSSVELEGAYRDLYSNCNEQLLLFCVKTACTLANFSDSSYDYIKQLIECDMRYLDFLEPTCTFKTLKGFSMGNCSAAQGRAIILLVYKLEIWKKLSSNGRQNYILRYLWLRDDINVHISGSVREIWDLLKIIIDHRLSLRNPPRSSLILSLTSHGENS